MSRDADRSPRSTLEPRPLRMATFLLATFSLAALATYVAAGLVDFEYSSPAFAAAWLVGLAVLMWNVAYMAVCGACSAWLRPLRFPRARLDTLPKTAVCYVAKNELHGLVEAVSETVEGNRGPHLDTWLLSNSDDERALSYEADVAAAVTGLRIYRSVDNPRGLKHLALQAWSREHPEYEYVVVCDADTRMARGTIADLLAIASHPAQANVAIFQTRVVVDRPRTLFASLMAFAQNLGQRIYVRANQFAAGQSVYFGSGALARREALASLDVPEHALSHDVWDAVQLDCRGQLVAYCEEIPSYEGYPNTYVESCRRDRRWVSGTLQALPLSWARGLSLGMRFYVAYPAYGYLSQPVFLAWIALGFFASPALGAPYLEFQRYAWLGASHVHLEVGVLFSSSMAVIVLHRVPALRSVRELFGLLVEIVFSTLLALNNVLYVTIAVASARRNRHRWIPMAKDSGRRLGWGEVTAQLWPSAFVGAAGIILGAAYSPAWLWAASPFLLSFVLAIPLTWITAHPLRSG